MADDVKTMLTMMLENIFGIECWDDSADETARRVLAYWEDFTPSEVPAFEFTTFAAQQNQMIIVKDIEFSSMCAHHLLPFYGKCHVAYLPNALMIGVSKIPRLVDFWAHRPCTQEALTAHIASDLKHKLEAMGVAVIIESRHTCMSCRGIRKHNGAMITSEMRGAFLSNPAAKAEFMAMIGRDRV